MSEIVRNESISTESLCTVIENDIGKQNNKNYIEDFNENIHDNLKRTNDNQNDDDVYNKIKENGFQSLDTCEHKTSNGSLNATTTTTTSVTTSDITDTCDTTTDTEQQTSVTVKPRTKIKKSVSFDPNDEKIQKFTSGEPIVDQQNPFKNNSLSNGSIGKKKRIPPPVPAKRSTLSIKKTVTQQLREREREKEKEKERLKNEANKSKSQTPTSPDDFITTEEVLRQSKYVKTYIKNPDPYFVYDPTVLARIKFEELRELAGKKPPKKLLKLSSQTRERLKDTKSNPNSAAKSKLPTFKKCSKPNYPNLEDIKVKVGTESDGNYFNPAEVTKNARKFDERVKKLHIDSDIDLDEIEEPLTKSESSDEVTTNGYHNQDTTDGELDISASEGNQVMNGFHNDKEDKKEEQNPGIGTFTNTIKSKEFQEYLEKKGLTLIPKKIPSGAQSMYTNGVGKGGTSSGSIRPNAHVTFRTEPEEIAHISVDEMDGDSQQGKKPSVFQRLLANSIFASRRNKTTPKETVPNARMLYNDGIRSKPNNGNISVPTPIKRVVLERQSFHGRPRVGNLLSAAEARELQQQNERSRKSFASGDDLSLSISSALTNAEFANDSDARRLERRTELPVSRQPVAKPPRRTLSGDTLSNSQQFKHVGQQEERIPLIVKPKAQRATANPNTGHIARRSERAVDVGPINNNNSNNSSTQFRRTLERQSLIPKRSTQDDEQRQMFGRSASMDRNEILKRSLARRLQNRSNSANESLKVPTNSKENLRTDFVRINGPKLTSTPRQDIKLSSVEVHEPPREHKILSPVIVNSAKPTNVYVDQQEWERLKAIKERTDRELYYKVLQQQLQQQQQKRLSDPESIYEHLKPNQPILAEATITSAAQEKSIPNGSVNNSFIRGSPQRNTFSGVIRNRQVKIIDGRAIVAAEISEQKEQQQAEQMQLQAPRSQSVLDNMTTPHRNYRRGYESDNETPVVMRRKGATTTATVQQQQQPQRRIGGLLTRDEILQKVKEFCRKSLNKTPVTMQQQPQMHAIYEAQHPTLSTDISPVSYASVETHQPRHGQRIYAAPQVPQRMQSLPQQQFLPITRETTDSTTSPVYAHVVKRSSLQSNQSELYDNPNSRPVLVRRESDAQSIYVHRAINGGGTLQRGSSNKVLIPTQYMLVDSDKVAPAQVLNYYTPQSQQQAELYAQPQYVRPHQLQAIPGPYGYITVRDPLMYHHHQQQQQQHNVIRQPIRLHDGRSTPLILESSSSPQQVSQIYWTPQHQRLQQQAGLLPVQISPRYVVKQPSYPSVPVHRNLEALYPQEQQPQYCSRVTKSGIAQSTNQISNMPSPRETINRNNVTINTPTNIEIIEKSEKATALQMPQPRQFTLPPTAGHRHENNQNGQHVGYDWESGSEAGEVQRIMERQRDSGGESKINAILRNLKAKVSQFIRSSK